MTPLIHPIYFYAALAVLTGLYLVATRWIRVNPSAGVKPNWFRRDTLFFVFTFNSLWCFYWWFIRVPDVHFLLDLPLAVALAIYLFQYMRSQILYDPNAK